MKLGDIVAGQKELIEFWVGIDGWLTVEAESVGEAHDAAREILEFFGLTDDEETSRIMTDVASQIEDFDLYKVEYSGALTVNAETARKASGVLKRYLIRRGLANDGVYWRWTLADVFQETEGL